MYEHPMNYIRKHEKCKKGEIQKKSLSLSLCIHIYIYICGVFTFVSLKKCKRKFIIIAINIFICFNSFYKTSGKFPTLIKS